MAFWLGGCVAELPSTVVTLDALVLAITAASKAAEVV
jgi:hypothetical protein